jgi:hypothetical protein
VTGPDLENRVGDQESGIPSRPVSSGMQVLGEPGTVVQGKELLCDLPAASIFPSKCPVIVPAEMSITPRR